MDTRINQLLKDKNKTKRVLKHLKKGEYANRQGYERIIKIAEDENSPTFYKIANVLSKSQKGTAQEIRYIDRYQQLPNKEEVDYLEFRDQAFQERNEVLKMELLKNGLSIDLPVDINVSNQDGMSKRAKELTQIQDPKERENRFIEIMKEYHDQDKAGYQRLKDITAYELTQNDPTHDALTFSDLTEEQDISPEEEEEIKLRHELEVYQRQALDPHKQVAQGMRYTQDETITESMGSHHAELTSQGMIITDNEGVILTKTNNEMNEIAQEQLTAFKKNKHPHLHAFIDERFNKKDVLHGVLVTESKQHPNPEQQINDPVTTIESEPTHQTEIDPTTSEDLEIAQLVFEDITGNAAAAAGTNTETGYEFDEPRM